jgi:endonuclease/exonuclease/phosphatase family metal-dependent hydrolase
MRTVGIPFLLTATVVSGTGCIHAQNYLDSSGPRYAGGSVAALEAPGNLRVVTFNIRYARQVDRAIELLRANAALRGADVVTLQEMDGPGVKRMAEALGLAYVYYPAAVHPEGGKDFGNAILVRGRILADHKVVLPHPGRFGGMRRIAVAVTAEVGGRRVRVYSTHLGTPKDVSAAGRREQVAAIVEDAGVTDDPVLVAGDFNNRGGVATAFESAGFAWLTRDVGRTISIFSWDHVFARGLRLGEVRSGAIDSAGASDHRAVWVELAPAATAPPGLLAAQDGPGRAVGGMAVSTALRSEPPPTR